MSRVSFDGTVLSFSGWIITHVDPLRLRRWRTGRVSKVATFSGPDYGCLLGEGVFYDHITVGLDEFALCGAVINTWTGGPKEATCGECRRIFRDGMRASHARRATP